MWKWAWWVVGVVLYKWTKFRVGNKFWLTWVSIGWGQNENHMCPWSLEWNASGMWEWSQVWHDIVVEAYARLTLKCQSQTWSRGLVVTKDQVGVEKGNANVTEVTKVGFEVENEGTKVVTPQ